MKKLALISLLFAPSLYCPAQNRATGNPMYSPTEQVITHKFVGEKQMKADLMQMLARFSTYMVNDWHPCQEPNSQGEVCGFFNGENSGGSDERGVRPNADLSMICAFLVKYAKPAQVELPQGVTWEKLEEMACQSLIFAYSTHKANQLKVCAGGRYWGSTSKQDAVWESSLWAMSVAYSAFFQWDKLSDGQKGYIYRLLKAECNYELERDIPTGYKGDTKAEENGWEADVLAATLGLFPNDELAPRWFERLREFAINSYSHPSDASNPTVIDPEYDSKTIADLYRGQNLYEDYTLQNHNLFHTSYQNVVQQELGEAALALKLFQKELHGKEQWKTNALMHHNQEVQDSVLNWLALADGELAMPNGNDWSLFLYDQITSYSTLACFLRDPNALMLENKAYKYIQARQSTTPDGSWLLRADVGARRMGVEAHRVMMTWLMHEALSTEKLKPTRWEEFNRRHSKARILPCQDIVRAATDSRFTCFSWSKGLKSYTGYIASNSPDRNKIIVPFRAHNTGNFLGWYEVDGKRTDAVPVGEAAYQLEGNSYVMNGELNTNEGCLNRRFVLYSTPGNAVIFMDYVTTQKDLTVKEEKCGLMAISLDELTRQERLLNYGTPDTKNVVWKTKDTERLHTFETTWMNIDDAVGVVTLNGDNTMAFGEKANNNSILTAKLYACYSSSPRKLKAGTEVNAHNIIYYSNVSAEETRKMAEQSISLNLLLPQGWNGVIATDPDGSLYLVVCNFMGKDTASLNRVSVKGQIPEFLKNKVSANESGIRFTLKHNESLAVPIKAKKKGNQLELRFQ